MNVTIKIFFLLNAILLLNSCGDCVQIARGTVLDKVTKAPIDSVLCKKVGRDNYGYSDTNGAFKVHAISGGLFGCPLMEVSFTKHGYKDTTLELSGSDDMTIYLERNK